MKRFAFPGAFLVLLSLSLGFAACGDDTDKNQEPETSGASTSEIDESNIRTTKGLTVAAVNAGFNGGGDDAGGGESYQTSLSLTGGSGVGSGPATGDMAAPKSAGGNQSSSNSGGNAQAAESGGGLTVTGYGTATAPADSAIIEFYFNTNSNNCCSGATPAPANRVTEDTVQPVVDALVAIGVAADDIEFVSQSYYDAYYSSGSLRVIARDVNATEAIAQAAGDASGNIGNGIILSSTNITYTVEDCEALEAAATRTAAEDAADNVDRLATALGLSVGAITAASDYSYPWYYPYFGEQTCGSSYYGPIVYYSESGGSLDDQPKEVQVSANINVTYAIR